MTNNKLQIDVGRGILTIESCAGRDSTIVTAYINGISLRCSSLHLDRVRDAFVDSVLSACVIDGGSVYETSATIDPIVEEIEAFISSALQ
jgi:hypothetical protein